MTQQEGEQYSIGPEQKIRNGMAITCFLAMTATTNPASAETMTGEQV